MHGRRSEVDERRAGPGDRLRRRGPCCCISLGGACSGFTPAIIRLSEAWVRSPTRSGFVTPLTSITSPRSTTRRASSCKTESALSAWGSSSRSVTRRSCSRWPQRWPWPPKPSTRAFPPFRARARTSARPSQGRFFGSSASSTCSSSPTSFAFSSRSAAALMTADASNSVYSTAAF